ncbi:MAG: dockerin type I domain-containing protein [Chthoniobacterales bacterium]
MTTSDCWAVGNGYRDTAYQTLTEHWDGNSWAIVSSPNTDPTQNNQLYSVSCTAASDCSAVGYTSTTSSPNTYQTLTEHWDGSAWTIVAPADANPAQGHFLSSVSCVAASDCWAVGYVAIIVPSQGALTRRTLTEHWAGSAWSVVGSPNTGPTDSDLLSGVTCVAGSDCWAVGYYTATSGGPIQTLTEHWDGGAWTIVSSPNRYPATDSLLQSVTCVTASDCWGAGTGVPNSFTGPETLIEHYTVPLVPLNSVVSRKTHGSAGAFDINLPLTGVLFKDTFAYPDGNLAGNGGWMQDGPKATNPIQVSSGHAVVGPGGQDVINKLDRTYPHIDGTSIYAAFDLTVTAGSSAGDFFFHYIAGTWSDRLSAKTSGSGFVLGLQSSTADVVSYGTTVLNFNTTYRVVLTWNFIAGATNDTMSIYVNPIDPGTETNNAPYLNYAWTTAGEAEPTSITAIQLRQADQGGAGSTEKIGNLSVGSSFTGVATSNGPRGIECRSGGGNGDYELVFTFANPLTSVGNASVKSGTGSVISSVIDSSDAHNYVVNLIGVTNAQVITVSLTNVNDSTGNASSAVSASMGVLLGDTNADGSVSGADVTQTKAQAGNLVHGYPATNFREDVTLDGSVSGADVTLVKRNAGHQLPP